jgi:cephalosporin hydroxylase
MLKKVLCLSIVGFILWGCDQKRESPLPNPSPSSQPALAGELTPEELGKKLSLSYLANLWNFRAIVESKFLGIRVLEHPVDMWVIQEMIVEIQPDFIIEAGTFAGGSALYYASILKEVNERGKVITIDIEPRVDEWIEKMEVTPYAHDRVEALFDDRIEIIKSNSVDPELVEALAQRVEGARVMVMLDSCHNYEHVLKELELYSPMVSVGSYIIVQDTIIDEGIAAGFELMKNAARCPGYEEQGGPARAVEEFLAKSEDFSVDSSRERFLVTMFPSGYLKRTK